jgi:hypothetical protein
MRKYLGRLFTSTKAHLVEIGRILGFPAELLERMRAVKDEECEAIFLTQLGGRWGGPVDWRGSAADIYEVLEPCLGSEERGHLPPVDELEPAAPSELVEIIDSHMQRAPRALRALDSLGDFIIVVLVPRERLSEVDRAARYWAA